MTQQEFQQRYGVLPEPMLALSACGEIIAANRAASDLLGRSGGDLRGQNLLALADDPLGRIPQYLLRWQRTSELQPGAMVLRRRDGSSIRCRAEGALLQFPERRQPLILLRLLGQDTTTSHFIELNERIEALNREIAERRRAEAALAKTNEQLRQANADLEQFAHSASHDLQEPLRTVAVYSQILQRRYGGKFDAQADQYLGYVAQAARRMQSLILDLLTYTRILTGQETAPTLSADAKCVLEQVVTNLRQSIEVADAKVLHAALPRLGVEEFHLLQLFQNLIGNAIKYRGAEPPVVQITAVREGPMCRISVRDNGIGIDPQFAEDIFGIFKRLHRSDEYDGTGIGLAICHKIVNRYGGRIWVESPGEGRGSTFSFTLPAADPMT